MTSLEKALKFVNTTKLIPVLNTPHYDGEYLVATNTYILYAKKEDMGYKAFSLPPCNKEFPAWKNIVFPDGKKYTKKGFKLMEGSELTPKNYIKKLKKIKGLTDSDNWIKLYDNGAIEIKNEEDDIYFLMGEKTKKSININIEYLITCLSVADSFVEIIFPKKNEIPLLLNYIKGDSKDEFSLIMPLKK